MLALSTLLLWALYGLGLRWLDQVGAVERLLSLSPESLPLVPLAVGALLLRFGLVVVGPAALITGVVWWATGLRIVSGGQAD